MSEKTGWDLMKRSHPGYHELNINLVSWMRVQPTVHGKRETGRKPCAFRKNPALISKIWTTMTVNYTMCPVEDLPTLLWIRAVKPRSYPLHHRAASPITQHSIYMLWCMFDFTCLISCPFVRSSSVTLVWWPPSSTEVGLVAIIHCMLSIAFPLKYRDINQYSLVHTTAIFNTEK